MPLELLGVPKQLFVVEELEEALVELSDVVPPVFRELYHHHDQVELPDGDEVRHDEGADGGGKHPSELGEKWLLQNTANCRSGKSSPSKIVISLSIEIGRLAWAFYCQLSSSYGRGNISYLVSYKDCNQSL